MARVAVTARRDARSHSALFFVSLVHSCTVCEQAAVTRPGARKAGSNPLRAPCTAYCAAAAAVFLCLGLKRIANWNLDFMSNSDEGKAYMDLVRASSSSRQFSAGLKAAATAAATAVRARLHGPGETDSSSGQG
jgi:hypothetical protein